MRGEKYSIEVSEGIVTIHGRLTIEEAFDFISFYDRKGFDEVGIGEENSCLRLFNNKVIYGAIQKRKEELESIPEKNIWEAFYEEKQQENLKLREKIKQLEYLIKEFMHPDPERMVKWAEEFNRTEGETDGIEASTASKND